MTEIPCFDSFQGCPALASFEKRLDKLDEAVDKIVSLLTNQAVQAQQLVVQQQMIREHSEALSAGRDRFSAMDLQVAQLSALCGGLENFKAWVATSGVATLVALIALAINIYSGRP